MYLLREWLEDFVELRISPEVLAEYLADIGLSVEQMENPARGLEGYRVFHVKRLSQTNSEQAQYTYENSRGELLLAKSALLIPSIVIQDKGNDEIVATETLEDLLSPYFLQEANQLREAIPDGLSLADALGLNQYVYRIDETNDLSYEEIGRLLSVQHGLPYFSPEPFVRGRDLELSEAVEQAVSALLKYAGIELLLLIEAGMPEVPEWLARRLQLTQIDYQSFPEAVARYVERELGANIISYKVPAESFGNLQRFHVYCTGVKSEATLRALMRVRQLWEQTTKTRGIMAVPNEE